MADECKTMDPTAACAICTEKMAQPNTVSYLSSLKCGHRFCTSCIDQWREICSQREELATCPTCRAPFRHARPLFAVTRMETTVKEGKTEWVVRADGSIDLTRAPPMAYTVDESGAIDLTSDEDDVEMGAPPAVQYETRTTVHLYSMYEVDNEMDDL